MKTARGSITGSAAKKFSGVFVFEEDSTRGMLSSTLLPAIKGFECTDATITYRDRDRLTETGNWTGLVGPENFEMSINDATIVGRLKNRRNYATRVHGSATWIWE